MKIKITFLHNARPYTTPDVSDNIEIDIPEGALPNTGDIVILDGITHPLGSFAVSHRVFEARQGSLYAVTLVLGIEGKI